MWQVLQVLDDYLLHLRKSSPPPAIKSSNHVCVSRSELPNNSKSRTFHERKVKPANLGDATIFLQYFWRVYFQEVLRTVFSAVLSKCLLSQNDLTESMFKDSIQHFLHSGFRLCSSTSLPLGSNLKWEKEKTSLQGQMRDLVIFCWQLFRSGTIIS